ncbi:MAG: hypothetical protein JO270_18890 [Acidobacteriaceae bacterium]|nr:hypothetical protein [Acidobacteriaceae bacterium]
MLLFAAVTALTLFGYHWIVPDASDWKIDEDQNVPVLHLVTAKGPLPGPRRPVQFAIAQTPEFRAVTLTADVRPLGRSLLIVFAYRDPSHFDYAHLSIDTAIAQPFHNGIFHVFGGERVRISPQTGPPAFPAGNRWYHVRLRFDGATGKVQVDVDGRPVPALEAVDLSLNSGRVGIGSFDETADFRNVKIEGIPVSGS